MMRYKIDIPVKEQPVTLISGITFAQVPYWSPFYNYKDLKMDILAPSGRPGQGKGLCLYGSAAAVSQQWSVPLISPGLPILQNGDI